MSSGGRAWVWDAVWLGVAFALSAGWAVSAGRAVGATFDEPTHLVVGLDAWRTGNDKQLLAWGAMPLPIKAQTLPLYVRERVGGTPVNVIGDWAEAARLARPVTLVWWALLLLYVLRWGIRLGGPGAGRLAVGLVAADPNLLGHAALATTDICLTAWVVVAAYHWASNRDAGWKRRVLLPGFLYGVALTAKASALPFVPLLWGVFGLVHLRQTGGAFTWAGTYGLRRDLFQAMALGFLSVMLLVGTRFDREPSFVAWADSLPEGTLKSAMVPAAEHLRIFPNAAEGLVQQIKHNFRGHGSFLLGTYHDRAVRHYFPVALTVKLADPTLLLIAATVLLRGRALANPAGLATVALLLFSLTARVQIGVRLVFPLVVFLFIAVAVACTAPGSRRRLSLTLGWLAVAATAVVSWTVWPDGVRHVNHLRGDPADGWQLLADSNFDWGQGLPDLRRWAEAHGEPDLAVWYYGIDPAVLLPPFRRVPVNAWPDPSPAAVTAAVGSGRVFAVSVSLLTACPDRRPATLAVIDWLRGLEVVGRTGTFVVYRVP